LEAGTALDAPVVVEFNQVMDQAAAQQSFTLADDGGQNVPGTFEWSDDGRTMTFTPSGLLDLGSTYSVTVAASEETGLASDVSWSFQTVPAPAVQGTQPEPDSTNAGLFGVHVFFSAPVDEATLDEDLLVVEPALPDDATFFYNSFDNSWNVSAMLDPSTNYRVTLRPGVADPYGNTIDEPYTWTFTTQQYEPAIRFNTQGQVGLYDASRTTELFVLHRNVSRIDFELASLSLEDFARLTGPNGYEIIEAYEPAADDVVRTWTVEAQGVLNEGTYIRVTVAGNEGGSL